MPVMALMIGLPLLMSLTWTFGVAYLAFGALNLMTTTLGLVLFGLGIDYGIHFYARYTEERGAGHSVIDAAERTFTDTETIFLPAAVSRFGSRADNYALLKALAKEIAGTELATPVDERIQELNGSAELNPEQGW